MDQIGDFTRPREQGAGDPDAHRFQHIFRRRLLVPSLLYVMKACHSIYIEKVNEAHAATEDLKVDSVRHGTHHLFHVMANFYHGLINMDRAMLLPKAAKNCGKLDQSF